MGGGRWVAGGGGDANAACGRYDVPCHRHLLAARWTTTICRSAPPETEPPRKLRPERSSSCRASRACYVSNARIIMKRARNNAACDVLSIDSSTIRTLHSSSLFRSHSCIFVPLRLVLPRFFSRIIEGAE